MRCYYSCGTEDHVQSRRDFLGSLAVGSVAASGLSAFSLRSVAAELQKQRKQMLVIWLAGGSSQLETWDPKPQTDTGGPFRDIATSVPGIRISELLPQTARQMRHLTILRGVNTKEDDHGKGQYLMHTGRREMPGVIYPHLGSVAARFLADERTALPGYIHITPGGGGLNAADAAFLGPKYGSLVLGNGQPPANTNRPGHVTETSDQARDRIRRRVNDHFALRRRTAETEAYMVSYDQARQLMERREVFDVSKEPTKDQERYGKHDFGRHCLLARRLLQAGVTFVKVSHSNYDTHNENFDFHLEQVGEFDGPFATLIADLAASGMLQHTLVVVMSEFGRTPNINYLYGRDHWSAAWSVVVAGCGVQPGGAFGKTNPRGTEVADGQVSGGDLFNTYLHAVGLDPTGMELDGRPVQLIDPSSRPIKGILA